MSLGKNLDVGRCWWRGGMEIWKIGPVFAQGRQDVLTLFGPCP